MEPLMNDQIITDSIRYLHLLAIAVGLGGSVLADLQVVRKVDQMITHDLMERLKHLHHIVALALVAMWISGAGLIHIRTGFVLEEFSPKLFSKLGVVTMLSFNAMLIGFVALPLLEKCDGVRLVDLSLKRKIACGWLASFSGASWLMALAMGESKVLAAAGWDVFTYYVPMIYVLALTAATVAAVLAHLLYGRGPLVLSGAQRLDVDGDIPDVSAIGSR